MKHKQLIFIAQAAVIAALYAGLSYAGWGVGFGSWQFRFSEALTLLPVLTPAAIPGLTVGCLLFNLSSPFGLIDIIFGSLATCLAALFSYWLRKATVRGLPWLSALMPVVFNGLIVGAIIALTVTGSLEWGAFTLANMLLFGGQVALCELVICFALGIPLVLLLARTPIFKQDWQDRRM